MGLTRLDKKDGLGWMRWARTKECYLGFYRAGVRNGFGMYEWDEDKGIMKQYRNRYIGFWRNGKRNGLGMFVYSNGDIYIGEWRNGKKCGFGVYIGIPDETTTASGTRRSSTTTRCSARWTRCAASAVAAGPRPRSRRKTPTPSCAGFRTAPASICRA